MTACRSGASVSLPVVQEHHERRSRTGRCCDRRRPSSAPTAGPGSTARSLPERGAARGPSSRLCKLPARGHRGDRSSRQGGQPVSHVSRQGHASAALKLKRGYTVRLKVLHILGQSRPISMSICWQTNSSFILKKWAVDLPTSDGGRLSRELSTMRCATCVVP